MSERFLNSSENDYIQDSIISKYKYLFEEYKKKPPTLEEALKEMFTNNGANEDKAKELIKEVQNKITNALKDNKYKSVLNKEEDAKIISSYTCELKGGFSPYTLLNKNLTSDSRHQGILSISKYLYIFLKSLRKLKKYKPKEEGELYRCIKKKVSLKEEKKNKNIIPYKKNNIKVFWAFSSASKSMKASMDFLGKENKFHSGTIFILTGEYIGYDISPFSCFKSEEEILLEPETKILIKDDPFVSKNIITIRCEAQKTKIILEDFFLEKKQNSQDNEEIIEQFDSSENSLNVNLIDDQPKKKKPKSFCKVFKTLILLVLLSLITFLIYSYRSELYDFFIILFDIDLENGIKCYENKRNGKCFGLGEEFLNGTIKYCGYFKDDIYSIEGILCDGLINCCKVNKRENTFYKTNDMHIIYNGGFNKNGEFHNQGELYKKGVVNYCGNFKNGKKSGKNGVLCLENKKCCTINDNNEIIVLDNENLKYHGDFENDLFNGKGTLYENGKEIFGIFENGNLINELKTESHEEKIITNSNEFLNYPINNINAIYMILSLLLFIL